MAKIARGYIGSTLRSIARLAIMAGVDDLKTASQWLREGRLVTKGEHAEMFRVSDDRDAGRALFVRRQTESASADPSDDWTVVVTASEWEQIKAEKKEVARQPKVKIRKLEDGGVEVWCGPDRDLIELLRHNGYSYQPASRYWRNVNKDAEQVATAFEHGKIRGRRVRVNRDWNNTVSEGLAV